MPPCPSPAVLRLTRPPRASFAALAWSAPTRTLLSAVSSQPLRRHLHVSPAPRRDASNSTPSSLPQVPLNAPRGTPLGQIDRRLRITFTCTASVPSSTSASIDTTTDAPTAPCGHRSSHEFSKRSYDHGVVLVQCPACHNRHLIADHLHWFSQTPSPAHPHGLAIGTERARTVEDFVRERGGEVKWGEPVPEGQMRWTVAQREEADGGSTMEVTPLLEEEAPDAVEQNGKEAATPPSAA